MAGKHEGHGFLLMIFLYASVVLVRTGNWHKWQHCILSPLVTQTKPNNNKLGLSWGSPRLRQLAWSYGLVMAELENLIWFLKNLSE